jgi:hypothetical protein
VAPPTAAAAAAVAGSPAADLRAATAGCSQCGGLQGSGHVAWAKLQQQVQSAAGVGAAAGGSAGSSAGPMREVWMPLPAGRCGVKLGGHMPADQSSWNLPGQTSLRGIVSVLVHLPSG